MGHGRPSKITVIQPVMDTCLKLQPHSKQIQFTHDNFCLEGNDTQRIEKELLARYFVGWIDSFNVE